MKFPSFAFVTSAGYCLDALGSCVMLYDCLYVVYGIVVYIVVWCFKLSLWVVMWCILLYHDDMPHLISCMVCLKARWPQWWSAKHHEPMASVRNSHVTVMRYGLNMSKYNCWWILTINKLSIQMKLNTVYISLEALQHCSPCISHWPLLTSCRYQPFITKCAKDEWYLSNKEVLEKPDNESKPTPSWVPIRRKDAATNAKSICILLCLPLSLLHDQVLRII